MILLKFRGLVHIMGFVMKTETTGGTGVFKWQCIAKCELFLFVLVFVTLGNFLFLMSRVD